MLREGMQPALGIIGGSGLYDLEGLKGVEQVKVDTPWGAPSDAYTVGTLESTRLIFLPRHGRGHRLMPSEINFRANIYGFKKLGATRLVSVSAVGSMREEIAPGHLVVVDQFFDRTRSRPNTFFGDGLVGHVSLADPVCPVLSGELTKAAKQSGATTHEKGTYLCIEGPQFSTRAESRIFRSWGVDVIGMTNLPEARLAREAELCYATLALATDYDCWHNSVVTVEEVVATLLKNVDSAKRTLRHLAEGGAQPGQSKSSCGCGQAVKDAILSDKKLVPEDTRRRVELLFGRYL